MIGALLTRLMVRRGCRHLNTRDLDAFLKQWHENAVFIYPGSTPASGEHRGKDAIRAWWLNFYDHFPASRFTTGRLYIKNITSLTASNEVALEWSVTVTTRNGVDISNRGVSLIDISRGKIARFQDFIDNHQALQEAWSSGKAL